MQLRRAAAEDIDAIMNVIRRVVPLMQASGNFQWNENYPNAAIFARDVEREQLWLAEVDHQIAGMAAITTDQEPEYAQARWDPSETAVVVHRLAVDPTLWGKGIAASLMRQAEVVASARKIQVLRVDTNTENEAMQKLFPKLGYSPAGEIGLGSRPGLKFCCYEKRLRKPGV
jgi:ribosomal protein S18 acetylase RimI-like enzyme